MRKTRGLDGRRDPGRVLDVINGLDAQVVALQEADNRLGERPAALCPRLIEDNTDFRDVPVATSEVSLGWHGNAVLVHKSKAVTGVTRIDLPGLERRGAVRVHFADGRVLVATHLGLLRSSRRQQLERIRYALGQIECAVIVGDFNEWRSSHGLAPLAARYDVLSPGRSFHAARPVAGLDRLAHTRDQGVRDAGVDQSLLPSRASIHLPIWADLHSRVALG